MPTVDSLLRRAARAQPDTRFWVLEKGYALGYHGGSLGLIII